MKTTSIKLLSLLLAASAMTLGGCGNFSNSRRVIAPESTYNPQGTVNEYSAALSDTSYDCPLYPNVTPDYDYDFDGSGHYTICKSRETQETVQIQGRTSLSDTICVFPTQYVNEDNSFWKPDPYNGGPLSTCTTVNDTEGVYLTFAGITFNAVFVVDKSYRMQMATCLAAGNYNLCPKYYSYGRFR